MEFSLYLLLKWPLGVLATPVMALISAFSWMIAVLKAAAVRRLSSGSGLFSLPG